MKLNSSSTGEELESLALAVHKLVNELPLTMRSTNCPGVRIEEGKVVDYNYTGPVLEEVLREHKVIQKVPEEGPYKGIPVCVVPIWDKDEVIAAMGVVDITQGIYSDIIQITKRPQDIKPSSGDEN